MYLKGEHVGQVMAIVKELSVGHLDKRHPGGRVAVDAEVSSWHE
jgi:hypothetical protein